MSHTPYSPDLAPNNFSKPKEAVAVFRVHVLEIFQSGKSAPTIEYGRKLSSSHDVKLAMSSL